ncbi:cholinesterase precursor [Aaosphaeria arxii CBS 175.79]|uniref:Carboxylic ester hydrolase n=1 Tax=Aaosphaeria arxii CBS 175.79 TaxID=1450172 RepID=A0A6A5XPA7_9PLEO|nr:cholinesterase precursor [Aaosphaeria arxii CBS 175.79]KAF2014736.1 cholinesterase precursor [Aaosphaeria arxii CBS 175.79]
MQLFVQALAAASLLPSAFAAPAGYTAPRVKTSSGVIVGHAASNKTGVTEFLGIKYATAERFAPPKRYNAPANTVYDASNWSDDCPSNKPPVSQFPNFTQPSGLRVWKNFAAQNSNPAAEDCLKLNIWTKTPEVLPGRGKPVLVWFHGGRFTIPGPHSPFYSGQYLTDAEDVLVVTVNYRLGIFGFSGAPGLQQNAALLDQRSAVEWVRDNIEGFGGDPRRIVIFGQSAGGSSVDYFSFAWKNDPIVSGLIPHSGTSLSFNPNTPEYAQKIWFNVTETIGCGGASDDSASVVACVRSKDVQTVLAAAAKVPALPTIALAQATFHPTIDNVTVFGNYEELTATGQFARIPMLLGNTDFESGWYKLSAFGAKINLTEAQWDLFNQRAFTCPNKYTATYRTQYGVATYRYRYHGDWDNIRMYNGTAGLGPRGSGAYHGSEINMVFGTAQDVSGLTNTAAENETIKYMQKAWGTFARDSLNGLQNMGWPRFNPNGNTLALLAYNNDPKPKFVNPAVYDAPCPAKNDPLPGQGGF